MRPSSIGTVPTMLAASTRNSLRLVSPPRLDGMLCPRPLEKSQSNRCSVVRFFRSPTRSGMPSLLPDSARTCAAPGGAFWVSGDDAARTEKVRLPRGGCWMCRRVKDQATRSADEGAA